MAIDATQWYLISFVIFIALVAKPLKGIILGALKNKSENINKELLEAKLLKEEALEILALAERKKIEAEFDATAILEHAQAEIEKTQAKMISDFDIYVEKQNVALSQRVLEMQIAAKDDIRSQMVDTAMKTAEALISKGLSAEKNIEYTLHELKRIKHFN